MTTFMLEEIDWTTRKINTTVNVCYNVTSHPDMLTNKELEAVTAAFKTFETGVREATIYPKVHILSNFLSHHICAGSAESHADGGPEPHRAGGGGHSE